MHDDDSIGSMLGLFGPDRIVNVPRVKQLETADETYDRLRQQIAEFEAELSDREEVGAYLAHFGREVTIRVEGIGYHNPGLIIFYGRAADGNEVRLVQHLSQLNVMLVKLPAADPTNPRRIVVDGPADDVVSEVG